MSAKELNELLKSIVTKNEMGVMLYNLSTGRCDVKLAGGSILGLAQIVKENFPNNLVERKFISKGCVKAFVEFVAKLESKVPSAECDVLFRLTDGELYFWMHFEYTLSVVDNNEIAFVVFKNINEVVRCKLINGFWNRKIDNGISRDNTYLLVNVDDGIIFDSRGKFAIKTLDLTKQVDYIAKLCCDEDMSWSLCDFLDKGNLSMMYKNNNHSEVRNVLIQDFDGIQKWFEISIIFSTNYVNGKLFAHIAFKNIDIKYRAIEDIKYNATHDLLTDVLNKHTFTVSAIEKFASLNNENWTALVFIDVDDFKKVNDSLGHSAGDKILRNVASGIKKSFRGNDIIGRIGGDEFMVLFSTPTLYTLYSRVNILNKNIREETKIEDISVSFGVVILSGVDHFDKLYELSDSAMYYAKGIGKNCYCIIDEYQNKFLSEAIAKVDNKKIGQMLNSKSKDFVFCHYEDGEVLVDYVTPKFFASFFGEEKIEKFEEFGKFLNETEFDKLCKMIQNSIKNEKIYNCVVEKDGVSYKVSALSVYDTSNGSIKIIVRFIKLFK